MRLEFLNNELSPVSTLALHSLRGFPHPLAVDVATRLLDSFDDQEWLCAELFERRLTHVVRSTCGPAEQVGGPDAPLSVLQLFADEFERIHLAELEKVQIALTEHGVPALVPKGVFFRASVYPQLEAPFSNDVDLLVPSHQLSPAADAMRALGYVQELTVIDNEPVTLAPDALVRPGLRLRHFGQISPFNKLVSCPQLDVHAGFARRILGGYVAIIDNRAQLRASFDLHGSLLGLHDEPGRVHQPPESAWWAEPQPVMTDGITFDAPADATVAWFIVNHLYGDVMLFGDRNRKILGDLIGLTRAGRVDFDQLAQTAERFAAVRPSLFYVFRALRSSFDVDIPVSFLDHVRSPARVDLADLGDPLARLLEVRLEAVVR